MSNVWFVTGASRGFGRHFVEAALSRGDKVAATARDAAALTELVTTDGDTVLPLQLNVTDKTAVFASVEQAKEHFGRLDVIVNNAGYGLFGAVEELTEMQLRTSWRPTSSVRSGSPREPCPTYVSRAPATSCRSPPPVG